MTRLALLLATSLLAAPAVGQDNLAASVNADMPALMPVYRDLHEHPELSFQETRSAALLARQARALGFEVTEGVGKTGVVAVMKNGTGPTLHRCAQTWTALPLEEKTGPGSSPRPPPPPRRPASPARSCTPAATTPT